MDFQQAIFRQSPRNQAVITQFVIMKDVDVMQSLDVVRQSPGSRSTTRQSPGSRAVSGQLLQYIEVGQQPPSEDSGGNDDDCFEGEESFFVPLF